jgi:uncharacterized YccA/Bax inhibitor family protein
MADRNWDKELAKVDKQLASLSDEQLLGAPSAAPVARQPDAARAGAKGQSATSVSTSAAKPTSGFWVYSRLVLALLVGAAMYIWPYPAKCGIGLAGYLAAVGVVIAGGLWASVWTWRHRAARAHTLSLLVVLWGLVLGAIQVLPRTGYAKPDANHPAAWLCQ